MAAFLFFLGEKVRSTTKGCCAVSFQSETYLIMSIMRGCFLLCDSSQAQRRLHEENVPGKERELVAAVA